MIVDHFGKSDHHWIPLPIFGAVWEEPWTVRIDEM